MPTSDGYHVDPSDPRAPSLAIWEQMSAAERQRVLDELPSEIEAQPEGDLHRLPKQRGLEALDAYFRRTGRRVYLSAELPVYSYLIGHGVACTVGSFPWQLASTSRWS
jgi:hypothetical protein